MSDFTDHYTNKGVCVFHWHLDSSVIFCSESAKLSAGYNLALIKKQINLLGLCKETMFSVLNSSFWSKGSLIMVLATDGCKCWREIVIKLLGLCGGVRGICGSMGCPVGLGVGAGFDIYFCVFFNCCCWGLVSSGGGRWAMPPPEFEIFPMFSNCLGS